MNRRFRDIFGSDDYKVVLMIIAIVLLFSLLVFNVNLKSSQIYLDFQHKEVFCFTQRNVQGFRYDKDCESFWYKTLFDPAIAWNFYYSCLTLALVLAAIVTVGVTIKNTNVQRKIDETVFIEEQRPWLTMRVIAQSSISLENGRLSIAVSTSVNNVGKSTAKNINIHAEMISGSFDEAELRFSELINERLNIEKSRDDSGSLLAPTEMESAIFYIGKDISSFRRFEAASNFVYPYVTIVLTYRGADRIGKLRYTARNFSIEEIRPGFGLPFAIDVERLPISNVIISSYPKHARAT